MNEIIYPVGWSAPVGRRITKLAFRNRFQQSEKTSIEMAAANDPAATVDQRQQAAQLRAYLADLAAASYIDLDRTDTRNGVQLLETLGLIGVGRASEILDSAITPSEIPVS